MFKNIDQYIKDRLNKIVFIELKKNVCQMDPRLALLKDIPIPVNLQELVEPLREKKNIKDISLATMAKGMITLIGLDYDFKYIKEYKEFLYGFDPKIEDYICYEGLKLAESEKFYDALIYFKGLIVLNADNINGLYNYGRCCQDIALKSQEKNVSKDFTKEAVEVFEIIVEKYPNFYQAYYYLGFHYANGQQYKKAQLTWKQALNLDIDDEKRKEILLQLDKIKDHIQYEEGYTLILNNQGALGIKKLIPLLDKYSDWWNLLFFIALGYRQLGDYEEAIKYLEKILIIKPAQVDTLNEMGLCYGALNHFIKAEEYFSKALKYKPQDSEILSNLGMVYMEQGKYDLAREVLNQSIQLNPDDEVTKGCIRKLEFIKKNIL